VYILIALAPSMLAIAGPVSADDRTPETPQTSHAAARPRLLGVPHSDYLDRFSVRIYATGPRKHRQRLATAWGHRVVYSSDSSRCVFYGRPEAPLAIGTKKPVEGLWWMDSEGHVRRLRRQDEYELSASSVLPQPPPGVFLYAGRSSLDEPLEIRVATPDAEDTLARLLDGGIPAAMDALATAGTNPDSVLGTRSRLGFTPLELAVVLGDVPAALRFVPARVSDAAPFTRATSWAVLLGRIEVLHALERAGAMSSDTTRQRSLRLVLGSRNFIAEGDPRAFFELPLSPALSSRITRERQRDTIRWLLSLGTDAGVPGPKGSYPLQILIAAGTSCGGIGGSVACWEEEARFRVELARELMEHGASVDASSSHDGWTALHWAAQADHPAFAEPLIRFLVEAGADPEARDQMGRTPVQELLARRGRREVVGMFGRVSQEPPPPETYRIAAVLASCGSRLEIDERDRQVIEDLARTMPATRRAK